VLTLLGQEQITPLGGRVTPSNAQQYFDQKEPHTKVELLAAAARFREQHQEQHKHTRADLKTVIHDEGRRDFDEHNFSWDIRNAKDKSLFTKGKDIQLSSYGQQYVDALPDREKVKKLRAPAKRRRKKESQKEEGQNEKNLAAKKEI